TPRMRRHGASCCRLTTDGGRDHSPWFAEVAKRAATPGAFLAMRRCAYCGRAGQLTREHLFPDFLVRESPGYRTYVDRARGERVHKSPPAIRDVCKRCNNGPLSALDSYGRVLTREYVCSPNAPEFPVRI